jgi:hypothetical protein
MGNYLYTKQQGISLLVISRYHLRFLGISNHFRDETEEESAEFFGSELVLGGRSHLLKQEFP